MWATFGRKMLVTWQPLDKVGIVEVAVLIRGQIRDYFGEEIGIYFAFLG